MKRFDNRKHSLEFVTCCGTPLHKVMHGEIQEDGTIKLVLERLENTDEIIDSYRQSTDIHNIIARIEAGDISLLNQKRGFYGDVTEMPKTYADMLNLMHRGEEFFNKLPVEVKEKYNNDFNQFFADFDNALKSLLPQQKEEAQEIVKSEESAE